MHESPDFLLDPARANRSYLPTAAHCALAQRLLWRTPGGAGRRRPAGACARLRIQAAAAALNAGSRVLIHCLYYGRTRIAAIAVCVRASLLKEDFSNFSLLPR